MIDEFLLGIALIGCVGALICIIDIRKRLKAIKELAEKILSDLK